MTPEFVLKRLRNPQSKSTDALPHTDIRAALSQVATLRKTAVTDTAVTAMRRISFTNQRGISKRPRTIA